MNEHRSGTTRRNFLTSLAAVGLAPIPQALAATQTPASAKVQTGTKLPAWTPGTLEIHHISTGRGNAAFAICPDGTTILIDAGAQYPGTDALHAEKFLISPKPDRSRRPGQWIARYIARRLAACPNKEIDYFVLTHLHTDHMGGLPPEEAERSSRGDYILTGVSDVHESVRIHTILDRAYPDYNYPNPLEDPNQKNYRAFLKAFEASGGKVEQFKPGSVTQISFRASTQHPKLTIQNLAANGVVWEGDEDEVRSTFPPLSELPRGDYPNENMCSAALRLSFGSFRYYAGGDLVHETHYGRLPWADIESQVAHACGQVDVATANHHGYVNGCGPEFVRQLQPQAVVISAWDSAHPTIPSLDNMLSTELYPGERHVFATALKPENMIATKRLAELASGNGHVVIRVANSSLSFRIDVVSNVDESDTITATFGPFQTTAKHV